MTGFGGGGLDDNTLDEPIWETLKRDVVTIGRNLRSVLIPVNWDFHNHTAALHNWDLWGPLVSALGTCTGCIPHSREPHSAVVCSTFKPAWSRLRECMMA